MATEAENRPGTRNETGHGAGTTAGAKTGQAMDTGTGNRGGGTGTHGTGDRTDKTPTTNVAGDGTGGSPGQNKRSSGHENRTETDARRSAGSGPGRQNPAGTKK